MYYRVSLWRLMWQKAFLIIITYHYTCMYVCLMYMGMHAMAWVCKSEESLGESISLFSFSCEFHELNSGCQAYGANTFTWKTISPCLDKAFLNTVTRDWYECLVQLLQTNTYWRFLLLLSPTHMTHSRSLYNSEISDFENRFGFF